MPISFTDALSELDQLQLLNPESIHRIEEVCQVIAVPSECWVTSDIDTPTP